MELSNCGLGTIIESRTMQKDINLIPFKKKNN